MNEENRSPEVAEKGAKPKKRISRRARKTRRAVIIAVVIALVALVWINWDVLSPVAILQRLQASRNDRGVQGEYPLDVAQDELFCLTPLGGGAFAAGRSGCYILGDKYPISYSYSLTSPTAAMGQQNALIYESGGEDYLMYSRDGLLFSRSSDTPIRCGAVAKNGIYALVTAPSDYTSLLSIYSVTHSVLFTQSVSDPNVAFTALSASAERVALVTLTSDGGRICSALTVYDTVETEPMLVTQLSGQLVLDMKFDKLDRLVLLTDRGIIYYNEKCELVSQYEYAENLEAFCLTFEGSAALLFDTGNVTTGKLLELIDGSGLKYSIQVPYGVKAVTASGNNAFYLGSGLLVGLDAEGRQTVSLECPLDTCLPVASGTHLFYSDEDLIYRSTPAPEQ